MAAASRQIFEDEAKLMQRTDLSALSRPRSSESSQQRSRQCKLAGGTVKHCGRKE